MHVVGSLDSLSIEGWESPFLLNKYQIPLVSH
jgi:hypothetical protein